MGDPSVSVVIPAHNAARFVGQAIESVLSQTYQPIECIVVNDGSEDQTSEVLDSFGKRIHAIHQDQAGVSAARNRGAGQAQGDLLAFLDADDLWLPTRIRSQVEVFVSHPDVDLVYGDFFLADEGLANRILRKGPPLRDALLNTITLEEPIVTVILTGLMTRDAFHATGGFDPRLSTCADLDLAFHLLQRAQLGYVSQPLAIYRQHDSQMHRSVRNSWRDMGVILDKHFSTSGEGAWVKYRGRILTNLHLQTAGGYVEAGDYLRAGRHLVAAGLRSPSALVGALVRSYRRSQQSRT